MNINSINNRTSFTGLNLYTKGARTSQAIKKNKVLAEMDKVVAGTNFDINIAETANKITSLTIARKKDGQIAVNFIPEKLAKVSTSDERVVQYPVKGHKKYIDIMYETTSDAEKHAWEYNFGNPILGKVQAAADVATKIG